MFAVATREHNIYRIFFLLFFGNVAINTERVNHSKIIFVKRNESSTFFTTLRTRWLIRNIISCIDVPIKITLTHISFFEYTQTPGDDKTKYTLESLSSLWSKNVGVPTHWKVQQQQQQQQRLRILKNTRNVLIKTYDFHTVHARGGEKGFFQSLLCYEQKQAKE